MNKRVNKILIGAGLTLTVFATATAVSYALTDKLVKVALERDGVKSLENNKAARRQLCGFEENADFMEKMRRAAEILEAQQTERVTTEAYDGTELVGHFYSAKNPKRVVIAMHGWRSRWSRDFGMMSEFFHDNGCSVLYVQQRAQGESGGEYMGFGLLERFDCLEWIKWVNDKTGGTLPVYLAGVSMGATTVLMASSLSLPQNVRGIIADCGFTSPHAIWKHVAKNNLHLSYGIRGRIASDICKRKIQMGTNDFSTLDALVQTDVPVLFIHGTDDHFVPIRMTFENCKACNSPYRLLVVPGADHGMSYYTNPEEYNKALTDFFAEFDENLKNV